LEWLSRTATTLTQVEGESAGSDDFEVVLLVVLAEAAA